MNRKDKRDIKDGIYLKDWLIRRLFLLVAMLCIFIAVEFILTLYIQFQDTEEFMVWYLIGALGPIFILLTTWTTFSSKQRQAREKFKKFYPEK